MTSNPGNDTVVDCIRHFWIHPSRSPHWLKKEVWDFQTLLENVSPFLLKNQHLNGFKSSCSLMYREKSDYPQFYGPLWRECLVANPRRISRCLKDPSDAGQAVPAQSSLKGVPASSKHGKHAILVSWFCGVAVMMCLQHHNMPQSIWLFVESPSVHEKNKHGGLPIDEGKLKSVFQLSRHPVPPKLNEQNSCPSPSPCSRIWSLWWGRVRLQKIRTLWALSFD